ncbi:MAG: NAD(P)-dependent oxidoreductase [Scytolyngbya sp. HA4215-MV1]|jgi:nucleoside-diphosphate-sugar epimerase|nr:NAD(P)-dependent oxidoreductase [Scytolyngbya sp. HA4215-MV1]
MKVFIAGATGAIGRPLICQLLDAGYDAFGMTRSVYRAHLLTQQGAIAELLDIFDADAVQSALQRIQPDVVIDLLTALPKQLTPESIAAAAALDERTRRIGGSNLQSAAQKVGVRRYILQSSAFWYAPGVGLADESTPFASEVPSAISDSIKMYADLEQRVFSAHDLEGIALRYGFLYGAGTWYAPDGAIASQVRQQQFPLVGNGQGIWSWVHVEDAAAATVAAVEKGTPGAFNIVDDTPLQQQVWLPAYAQWLGAKPPLHVSVENTLQVQGADLVYYATQLRGASNAKAKRELGFQPRSREWLAIASQIH